MADLSPRQLELNREKVAEAGLEDHVLDRVVADVTELGRFEDGSFDVAVCFGGPLSYLVDQAEEGVAELVRVTRPGGHVLLWVMSLVGAASHYTTSCSSSSVATASSYDEILRTGVLPQGDGYGHLPMSSSGGASWRSCSHATARWWRRRQPGYCQRPSRTNRSCRSSSSEPSSSSRPSRALSTCGEHILAVLRR